MNLEIKKIIEDLVQTIQDDNLLSTKSLRLQRKKISLLDQLFLKEEELLRGKCKHLEVVAENESDPHKGITVELYCKDCEKSMYSCDGNYYPYPVSSGEDGLIRKLVRRGV